MTKNDVRQFIRWARRMRLKMTDWDLFTTAYLFVYGEANQRCLFMFRDYVDKGIVPSFVVSFIRSHTLIERKDHESQPSTS